MKSSHRCRSCVETRLRTKPLKVARAPFGDPATQAERIVATLRRVQLPTEPCFMWVAVESHVPRAIRRYPMDERGIDKRWIKADGYWRRGAVGTHKTITDED